MTLKTKKYHFAFYILVVAVQPFGFVGCRKGTGSQSSEMGFETEKQFPRGPLTVHVRVQKEQITIAETVMLELEAVIKPGYEVKMPKVDKILQNFGIIDWQNLGDRLDKNNNLVHTYQYRLEPFLSGAYSIPALSFEFHDVNSPEENKYELTTEPIDIEVTSLLGEQRAELIISDIEDVVQMPKKSSYWWVWTLAVMTVAIVCLLFYSRRRRAAQLIRIFKPAHEIAYERLRVLVKEDLVNKGMIKEFYERISNILRHYIEDRFNLRAPERTTEEFLIELSSADVFNPDDKANIGEFLKLSDLVKFAKHNPTTDQIQQTFDLVKNFIEKTKSEEKPIDVTEQVAEVA